MMRFPPDRAVLLFTARAQIDGAARRRLEDLLAAPIRWRALLGGARHHGLAPLLAERLQEANLVGRVPLDVRAELLAARDETLACNLVYRDQFRIVVSALAEAGIPTIALKGLALAEWLYDHIGQRPMTDIDLLVQPGDVPKAAGVLSGLGYRPQHGTLSGEIGAHFQASIWPSAHQRAKHWQLRHRRAGVDCLLELHWTLEHAGHSDRLAALWRNSRETRVAGVRCRQLGPEDELVHLLAHFGLHGFGPLLWLSDLDRLVRQSPRPDWIGIGRMTRQTGLRLAAASTAYCLRSWLGTPVPGVFGSPGALRRMAANRALVSDGAEPGVPNRYWPTGPGAARWPWASGCIRAKPLSPDCVESRASARRGHVRHGRFG